MASIKGLQKTSLVDYPPYIACTIFFSGCNFRCGFCYNIDIVNDSKDLKEYSEEEIFKFLDSRGNLLDAVCLTGGEPTLYPGLKEFISKIREKGFKIKIDTNGLNPSKLKEVIKLVDYVAMDIKSSKEKYSKAAGVKVDISKIEESVELIKNDAADYEFRTTVIPEFFTEEDVVSIGKWLKGSKKYALQQFKNNVKTLDPMFMKVKAYPEEELEKFKKILDKFVDRVEVRT
jgi:pyruvate formate lyase activating enzyme